MSFVFREPKQMHEAQCCIVSFLRILDFDRSGYSDLPYHRRPKNEPCTTPR
jgi:hypothetical protein